VVLTEEGLLPAGVLIRAASPNEVETLRTIAAASKGFWGYQPDRVRTWAQALEPFSASAEVYVASVDSSIVGWIALTEPSGGVCVLDGLWVLPEWIRKQGIGSVLFNKARERARMLGGHVLELEAEPNSRGFYEKMGAVHVRDQIANWGRPLPVMSLRLT